jgi:hypothetical protein
VSPLIAVLLSAAPSLQLEWSAPPSCPDRDWLLAEVLRLRRDALPAESADVVVHATVHQRRGRWQIDVETRHGDTIGHRTVAGDTCKLAAQAAALVVSLALTPRDRPLPAVKPAPLVSSEPVVSASTEPELIAPSTKLVLAVSAIARAGPLPELIPGVAVSVGFWRNGLQVEATWFTPATQYVQVPQRQARARLELPYSGELAVEYSVLERTIEVDLLADLAAGWMTARADDIAEPKGGGALWLALEGGAALRFMLAAGLWARLEGRAGASLVQPRVSIDLGAGPVQVFTTPLFTARGGLGIEYLW